MPTGPPLHPYQILSNFLKQYGSFVCVEVLRPSQPNGVMSSMVSLPNHTFTGQAKSSKRLTSIVHILSLEIVWELWPAQDFGFRGDNYITKTVRVVSLAHDMPIGPPLHSYQILSKYV